MVVVTPTSSPNAACGGVAYRSTFGLWCGLALRLATVHTCTILMSTASPTTHRVLVGHWRAHNSDQTTPVRSFFILSDQSTVSSLIGSVNANCSSSLDQNNTSKSPTPYTNSSTAPLPEQVVQYYRASSVVLTLDRYNDTAALNGTQNLNATGPALPFPNGTDTTLLTCLNETIGRAVPLVDAGARTGPPAMHALVLAWVLVAIARSLF